VNHGAGPTWLSGPTSDDGTAGVSDAARSLLRGTVLITQPIHPAGVTRLEAAGLTVRHASSADMNVVRTEIADAVAVVTRSAGLNAAAIEAGNLLRVIGNHGSGLDAIDLDAAARRGVPVVRTPGANAPAVAEMTLALILATLKRLGDADRAVRAGDEDFKYRTRMGDLTGATVGIVGFGAIGATVAGILRAAFDVRLLVHTRTPRREAIDRVGGRSVSLKELVSASDVVTLHRPAEPNHRAVIDAALLALMKPTAVLINTARGSLIEEDALAKALRDGRLGGAGLDVARGDRLDPNHPLTAVPNVILTPHVAGSSEGALRRTALAVVDAVVEVLRKDPPA